MTFVLVQNSYVDNLQLKFFWYPKRQMSSEKERLMVKNESAQADLSINSTRGDYSIWVYLMMAGACDSVGNVLGFIAQQHLPQVLYQLFLQSLLVFSAVLSVFILNKRYSFYHILGIISCMAAGIIGISPNLSYESIEGKSTGSMIFYCIVAVFSTLPTALSYVLKEKIFNLYKDFANDPTYKDYQSHRYNTASSLNVIICSAHVSLVQLFIVPFLVSI